MIHGVDGRVLKGAQRLAKSLVAGPLTRAEGMRLDEHLKFVALAESLSPSKIENEPSVELTKSLDKLLSVGTELHPMVQRAVLLRHIFEHMRARSYSTITDMVDMWAPPSVYSHRQPQLRAIELETPQKCTIFNHVFVKTMICNLIAEGRESVKEVSVLACSALASWSNVDLVELDTQSAATLTLAMGSLKALYALATPTVDLHEYSVVPQVFEIAFLA